MSRLKSCLQKLAVGLVAVSHFGCISTAEWVGMKLIFDPVSIPQERVQRDISYGATEATDDAKHRLDFYLPEGNDWPTMVFVHGGGWNSGDKDLRSAGYPVYGNIGAFYAEQGVATAIISYRLQPEVDWRDQVQDVARSVARVRQLVRDHGGSERAIFLSGHSAGGQLAAFTAVADWPLADLDLKICGVIAISGAGYDLADMETYELGATRRTTRGDSAVASRTPPGNKRPPSPAISTPAIRRSNCSMAALSIQLFSIRPGS